MARRRSRKLSESVSYIFALRAAGDHAKARKLAKELRRDFKGREIEHEIKLQTSARRRQLQPA